MIEPGTYNCSNVGDVAMLQVAVNRLRRLWPFGRFTVFTADEAALRSHCPDVHPLGNAGRAIWLEDRYLLGRLHRRLPKGLSRYLVRLRRAARARAPRLSASALHWRASLRHGDVNALNAFLEQWRSTNLVCIAGQATLADHSPEHAATVLATLEAAIAAGIPTAMLGQGVGPLTDPELRARCRAVLPGVELIAVREGRTAPRLLADLGVDPARVVVTGDDALELAAEGRRSELGDGLGVNLRVTAYAAVDAADLARVRTILQEFARAHGAPLRPIPIARRGVAQDPRQLRELLRGYDDTSTGGDDLTTPAQVIAEVSRCRVVVTGAYHAAVFALALGVPAICLARSQYYVDKFRGLAELFGPGCVVMLLDQDGADARLRKALSEAWRQAGALSGPLRLAAEEQSRRGREVSARLGHLIRKGV